MWTLISKKRRQKEKESRCHVDGVELRNTCPRVRIAEARHFAFLCRRFSNDSITTIRSARALDNVCRILDEARHGQHLKWACSCQQPAADRERISLWHVQVYERMNIRNMFFPERFRLFNTEPYSWLHSVVPLCAALRMRLPGIPEGNRIPQPLYGQRPEPSRWARRPTCFFNLTNRMSSDM